MKRVSLTIVCAVLLLLATPQIAFPFFVSRSQTLAFSDQSPNDQQLQMFAGTIVAQINGKFFLQVDADKTLYGLDNQALASKFVDKKVVVTGSVDKANTIHIKNIEEQKA